MRFATPSFMHTTRWWQMMSLPVCWSTIWFSISRQFNWPRCLMSARCRASCSNLCSLRVGWASSGTGVLLTRRWDTGIPGWRGSWLSIAHSIRWMIWFNELYFDQYLFFLNVFLWLSHCFLLFLNSFFSFLLPMSRSVCVSNVVCACLYCDDTGKAFSRIIAILPGLSVHPSVLDLFCWLTT